MQRAVPLHVLRSTGSIALRRVFSRPLSSATLPSVRRDLPEETLQQLKSLSRSLDAGDRDRKEIYEAREGVMKSCARHSPEVLCEAMKLMASGATPKQLGWLLDTAVAFPTGSQPTGSAGIWPSSSSAFHEELLSALLAAGAFEEAVKHFVSLPAAFDADPTPKMRATVARALMSLMDAAQQGAIGNLGELAARLLEMPAARSSHEGNFSSPVATLHAAVSGSPTGPFPQRAAMRSTRRENALAGFRFLLDLTTLAASSSPPPFYADGDALAVFFSHLLAELKETRLYHHLSPKHSKDESFEQLCLLASSSSDPSIVERASDSLALAASVLSSSHEANRSATSSCVVPEACLDLVQSLLRDEIAPRVDDVRAGNEEGAEKGIAPLLSMAEGSLRALALVLQQHPLPSPLHSSLPASIASKVLVPYLSLCLANPKHAGFVTCSISFRGLWQLASLTTTSTSPLRGGNQQLEQGLLGLISPVAATSRSARCGSFASSLMAILPFLCLECNFKPSRRLLGSIADACTALWSNSLSFEAVDAVVPRKRGAVEPQQQHKRGTVEQQQQHKRGTVEQQQQHKRGFHSRHNSELPRLGLSQAADCATGDVPRRLTQRQSLTRSQANSALLAYLKAVSSVPSVLDMRKQELSAPLEVTGSGSHTPDEVRIEMGASLLRKSRTSTIPPSAAQFLPTCTDFLAGVNLSRPPSSSIGSIGSITSPTSPSKQLETYSKLGLLDLLPEKSHMAMVTTAAQQAIAKNRTRADVTIAAREAFSAWSMARRRGLAESHGPAVLELLLQAFVLGRLASPAWEVFSLLHAGKLRGPLPSLDRLLQRHETLKR